MTALISKSKHVGRSGVWVTFLLVLAVSATSVAAEEAGAKPQSRFLKELKKQKYTETKAPATAPVFRWDFSGKDVHTYAFLQESQAAFDMGPTPEGLAVMEDAETAARDRSSELEQSMSTKGVLLVKSQGDGTANLVLKDMEVSLKADFGEDEEPKAMEQSMPPLVVQGMKEDGSASFGNSSQDVLLKMLFPLPSKPLKVGETIDVSAQVPFNVMGSLLPVKGRSRITLTRYVKIGERTCAQLNVDIDVSDLKAPSELKGEYECTTRGASVFYFDVAERCFVSGVTAILSQGTIDAPMPTMSIPGEKVPDKPERTQVAMMSDNLIRISLKEESQDSQPGAPPEPQ